MMYYMYNTLKVSDYRSREKQKNAQTLGLYLGQILEAICKGKTQSKGRK